MHQLDNKGFGMCSHLSFDVINDSSEKDHRMSTKHKMPKILFLKNSEHVSNLMQFT